MQLLQQFILKLLAHWVSWVKHRIRVNEFPEMAVTVQDRRKGIKKLLPTVEIGIQQVKSSLLSGTLPHHHAKRFTIFLALSQMKAQDPHWNIVLYLKCQYLICSLLAFSTGQRLQLPLVCATSPSMQFLWKVKKKKPKNPELTLPQHKAFTESKAALSSVWALRIPTSGLLWTCIFWASSCDEFSYW